MPVGLSEYCAAKAAGEALIKHLNQHNKSFNITSHRFPRINTDQTATLHNIPTANVIDELMKALDEMKDYNPHLDTSNKN